MAELLIRNALVKGALCDILVSGDRIKAIGHDLQAEGAEIIEQYGNVVIPGFVDCHVHLDKCHLNDGGRSCYVHGTGAVKGALTRDQKSLFTVEDIKRRASLVLDTAVRSGTLVMRTNCDVDPIVGLKGIEALLALREEYKDRLRLQVAAFAQEGVFQAPETPKLLEDALRMGADLIGGHTITCGEGERHIDFILELAAKYGVEADFHLDESGNRENYLLPYTVKRMAELGLNGRVNGIHMCTLAALTDEELTDALRLIWESGLKATIAPTAISTRKIAPVKKLLEAGIPVGLGSDNIRDFFNPYGSGNIRHIASLLCYLQAFFTDEEASQIWNMITYGGASVLGDAAYGIFAGAPADLTLFDSSEIREILAEQSDPALLIRAGKKLI